METLFEVHFTSGLIAKVNAEKTTPKMVFVERGFKCIRREPWVNAYSGFYRTFHEAQKAGKDRFQTEIDSLLERLAKKIIQHTAITNLEEDYVYDAPVFHKLDTRGIEI
jgi:hypothetical protein